MMATVFLLSSVRWVGCVWRSVASISESPSSWNWVSSPVHRTHTLPLMTLIKTSSCAENVVQQTPAGTFALSDTLQ